MKHILAREGFLGRAAVLLILLLALAAIWVPDRSSAVQTEGSSSMPGPSQTPAPGRMGPDTGATKLVPSGTPTSAEMEEKRRIPRTQSPDTTSCPGERLPDSARWTFAVPPWEEKNSKT